MKPTVRVILGDARRTARRADEIIGGIPQYYAGKYRTIRAGQEAAQELTAGYLLKRYLGVSRDNQLTRSKYGKPALRSGAVYFNLSHSGDYVALAVADMEIGVDLERVMDVHWPSAEKIFSAGQVERLKRLPKRRQPHEFTRLWTGWEAVLKLWGTGFGAELAGPGGQPAVHWAECGDYRIACAAFTDFAISVEEDAGPEFLRGDICSA